MHKEHTTPKFWEERAELSRKLAEQMNDEISKSMMYRVAADYERLALRCMIRLSKEPERGLVGFIIDGATIMTKPAQPAIIMDVKKPAAELHAQGPVKFASAAAIGEDASSDSIIPCGTT